MRNGLWREDLERAMINLICQKLCWQHRWKCQGRQLRIERVSVFQCRWHFTIRCLYSTLYTLHSTGELTSLEVVKSNWCMVFIPQEMMLYGFDPSRDADGTLQLGAFRGAYVSRGSQIKLLYGFDPSRDTDTTFQEGVYRGCHTGPR